jgi:DNA-binding HxlR family transcriptional regulator
MSTRTAAQRREQAREEYDAFLAACPSHKLLATLADKWTALVLVGLDDGPQRYSELSRRIAGVSQKMLTQTLRSLERDGLISRAVTASVPVRVDYALTDLGADLMPVLRALKHWAEVHMSQVEAAQADYDARRSGPT